MDVGLALCLIVLMAMIVVPVAIMIRTPSDEESLKKRFAADDLRYAASGTVSKRYSAPDVMVDDQPSSSSEPPSRPDLEPKPTKVMLPFWDRLKFWWDDVFHKYQWLLFILSIVIPVILSLLGIGTTKSQHCEIYGSGRYQYDVCD
ncbi:hypothetical protein G6K96_21485 [Agrobacterium vitis]|uniref:hypothetical protein n=1 Tax=Agrobacterium vitis TaxID=373 RepID=UPI001574E3FB|nr:hypothetical protein [Agrobacterium vitis]NTA34307.1 hypothetical protein [Agrobacterium vitis]